MNLIEIEPGILPVCDALNAIQGIETLFSCEGHPSRPWIAPYVMFRASISDAFKIHKSLSYGHGIHWQLKFCWQLIAAFYEDGTLKYTLKPNDVRFCYPDLRFRFFLFPSWRIAWRRSEMDEELIRLSSLIRKCFSTNRREQ